MLEHQHPRPVDFGGVAMLSRWEAKPLQQLARVSLRGFALRSLLPFGSRQ
jgi:hypothetical protein